MMVFAAVASLLDMADSLTSFSSIDDIVEKVYLMTAANRLIFWFLTSKSLEY
jgi:hypothetical protein